MFNLHATLDYDYSCVVHYSNSWNLIMYELCTHINFVDGNHSYGRGGKPTGISKALIPQRIV